MSVVDGSVIRIMRGGGLALSGTLFSAGLIFIGRVLVAQIGTKAEYGVFSLAFVVLSICTIVATLGLELGATRSIAFARGVGDSGKVGRIIPAAIQLSLVPSCLLCTILFFTSDIIATSVFEDPALGFPLRLLSFGVPFFTLLNVVPSIFRGFDNVRPRVYFRDILRSLLFPLFLVPFVAFDLSFNGVFLAFLGSLVIPGIALIAYTGKRLPSAIRLTGLLRLEPEAWELLRFSAPLLAHTMLLSIILWLDTLMLGALKTSSEVGLYNAAHPLANFVSIPMQAMLLIYVPVATHLYSRGEWGQMGHNYRIMTKWLFAAVLPFFMILLLVPGTVLSMFGEGYDQASTALRILTAAFILNNFMGPNGATLIAMGKVEFMMWTSVATAALNVGLNFALIPRFGIEGAAIAFLASTAPIGILRCTKLHAISSVHPLSKNLIKVPLAAVLPIALFQVVLGHFVSMTWWMLPLIGISYYALLVLAMFISKSIDREDREILALLRTRAGEDLSQAMGLLKRRV